MKKTLALLLASTLLVSAVACSSSPAQEKDTTAPPSSEESSSHKDPAAPDDPSVEFEEYSCDTGKFSENVLIDIKENNNLPEVPVVPASQEFIDKNYPGLKDVKCKQTSAYISTDDDYIFELIAVEVEDESSLNSVFDIVSERKHQMKESDDIKTSVTWDFASIMSYSNYVIMVAGNRAAVGSTEYVFNDSLNDYFDKMEGIFTEESEESTDNQNQEEPAEPEQDSNTVDQVENAESQQDQPEIDETSSQDSAEKKK